MTAKDLTGAAMTFTLLDSIDISDGRVVRRIALYEGDLAAIPDEHHADILIVSAFPNNYAPTRWSLIGALDRRGLSIAQLATKKAHDLRSTCAFWISNRIGGPAARMNIGQIACFEPQDFGAPPAVVGDLFRGLFPFLDERRNQVVAMSILAGGDQGNPPGTMLRAILDAASHWLARGLPISELKIVERNLANAQTLAETMEEFKQQLNPASLAPSDSNEYDVFLSFSSKDGEAADFAKTELQRIAAGRRVFDFRIQIDKGASWQEELDRAITSCKRIIVILSPAYLASPECREELMQGRLRNKRSDQPVLLPIYWRDWGKDLDLWLQALNYADCRESDFTKLKSALTTLA
jgi:hypothetical protein